METKFKKESSYAVVIQSGDEYIVFQKNHFDDDMGSFGEILKNHEPLNVSKSKKTLRINFTNVTYQREILLSTLNEDQAITKMNAINSFI